MMDAKKNAFDAPSPFMEIDGFLYRISDKTTDYCAAKLSSAPGFKWHLYHVKQVNDGDLQLKLNGKVYYAPVPWLMEQGRLQFYERATISVDGLPLPDERIPQDLDNVGGVFEWLYSLYEYEIVFDLEYWNILSDDYKAVVICYISMDRGWVESSLDRIVNDILPVEKEKQYPVIYALLCYLLAGTYRDAEKKDFYLKEGHNTLLHAITDASLDHYNGFDSLFRYVLPSCYYMPGLGGKCDVYRKKKNKEFFLACHHQGPDTNFRAPCPAASGVRSVSAFKSHHMKRVEEHETLPDLGDLVSNLGLDTRVFAKNNKEKLTGDEYAYVIAGYAIRAREIADYLECDYCHHKLYPDLYQEVYSDAYSITTFSCEKCIDEPDEDHDVSVYINHCIRCYRIIDSRECMHQEKEYTGNERGNMWLCMRCGGTRNIQKGSRCPRCGNELNPDEMMDSIVRCECGHDGARFGINPVPEERRRH